MSIVAMIVLSNNYKVIETNNSSITITLSRWLTSGTDSGCEQFKIEMDQLVKLGKTIKILNREWIPGGERQITPDSWHKRWNRTED